MAIQISGSTVIDNSKNVNVGTSASVTAGKTFIANGYVGLGTIGTTERNGLSTATGTIIYNIDDTRIQVWDGATWVDGFITLQQLEATGGAVDTATRPGFKVHTFTGDGTFTVTSNPGNTPGEIELFMIGGGGSGGGDRGGGGGAGGVYYKSDFPFTGTSPVTVTIGQGGDPGGTTSFGLTSIGGGGRAGYRNSRTGLPGVSGGGAGAADGGGASGAAGTGDPGGTGDSASPANGWGNNGGNGFNQPNGAGGGGGGGGGGNGNNGGPGSGGSGGGGLTYTIDGGSTARAGGGGGGGFSNPGPASAGGGAGTRFQGYGGAAGTPGTGGGGGGSTGGSGILIVAYPYTPA